MSTPTIPPLPPAVATSWRPLGLPTGSVRALLTLMIVGVVCLQVARGEPLDLIWSETLAIALAHYFTSRRFVDLPPELLARLKSEGVLPDEPQPLYLPGHTVRGLILLAFLGLALYLERQGRLHERQAVTVLGLVGVYLLGVIGQWLRQALGKNRQSALRRAWENLKAFSTLVVMATTLTAYAVDQTGALPSYWREVTLAMALFYFGSR